MSCEHTFLCIVCYIFDDEVHFVLQGEEVGIEGGITSMVCIRDELMLATTRGHVLRYRWDGSQNRDYCLDLRRVPFCIDQQVSKGSFPHLLIIAAVLFVMVVETTHNYLYSKFASTQYSLFSSTLYRKVFKVLNIFYSCLLALLHSLCI